MILKVLEVGLLFAIYACFFSDITDQKVKKNIDDAIGNGQYHCDASHPSQKVRVSIHFIIVIIMLCTQ